MVEALQVLQARGVEKIPISGIWGTCRKRRMSRARLTSSSGVPLVFTTPKAAISGLSFVGRSLVTTSPFSIAGELGVVELDDLAEEGEGRGLLGPSGARARDQDRPQEHRPTQAL